MTIQQSSESRAISTTALKPGQWTCEMGTADSNPESALKFYCYICKTNCCNQQVQIHRSDWDGWSREVNWRPAATGRCITRLVSQRSIKKTMTSMQIKQTSSEELASNLRTSVGGSPGSCGLKLLYHFIVIQHLREWKA